MLERERETWPIHQELAAPHGVTHEVDVNESYHQVLDVAAGLHSKCEGWGEVARGQEAVLDHNVDDDEPDEDFLSNSVITAWKSRMEFKLI